MFSSVSFSCLCSLIITSLRPCSDPLRSTTAAPGAEGATAQLHGVAQTYLLVWTGVVRPEEILNRHLVVKKILCEKFGKFKHESQDLNIEQHALISTVFH